MKDLTQLFDKTGVGCSPITKEEPEFFFSKLAGQQAPEYLWMAVLTQGTGQRDRRPAG